MTKIAIISQPEQGVLIDVGGCASVSEATQHLTSTLQVSSQFWEDQPIDLNLGLLSLNREELAQLLATLSEVGLKPRQIFARSASTKAALRAMNVTPASGKPASLPGGATQGDTAWDGTAEAEVTSSVVITAAQSASPVASPSQSNPSTDAAQAPVTPQPAQRPEDQQPVPLPVDPTEALTEQLPDPEKESQSKQENIVAAGDSGDVIVTPPQPKELTKEPSASAKPQGPHIMYLNQTLRSGQTISHKGHLVIVGDVNAGAEVIAEGDITIWGNLRGIAHAGVSGNTQSEIRALRFDPIQLRIAQAIARSPDRTPGARKSNGPETARILNGTIRIQASTPE